MKVLSLFSGIGAFEKALDRLKVPYQLVNYCEIDKYASKAYAMIHDCDESLNLGDITKIDTSLLPNDIDLITYGFPCQDISLAGKQKGFEADGERTRSGLFFEALRIIEDTKPRIAIAENVKNLTSKKFQKEFDIVLSSLEQAGYNNYWKVLNAKDYGIPQNRERVFIVSIRKDVDNGMLKFPKPFELKLRLKDMLEDEVDEKFYLKEEHIKRISNWKSYQNPLDKVAGKESIMSTITTRVAESDGGGVSASAKFVSELFEHDENVRQMIKEENKEGLAPTLDTMQGGYRQPCIEERTDKTICLNSKGGRGGVEGLQPSLQNRIYDIEGISPACVTSYMPSIAIKENTKQGYKEAYECDGVYLNRPHQKRGVVQKGMIQTLKTSCSDVGVVVDKPLCIGQVSTGNSQAGKVYSPDGVSQTLCAGSHGYAMGNIEHNLRIRKLTPLECFRLMGFDDSDFNKTVGISNTQLYKMAGNSIVVDVLVQLFKSLFEALESDECAEIIEQQTLFEEKEEEIMEEVKQEEMIQWNEIDDLIGKPVFDKDNGTWRILDGYQRVKKDYFVSFTDTDDFEEVDLNCTNLFRNEVLSCQN